MDISQFDKNMTYIKCKFEPDIKFYDARKKPIKTFGMFYDETEKLYKRMPQKIADTINNGVKAMNNHTTGGRFSFKTDSMYIGVKMKMPLGISRLNNLTLVSSCGMDVYIKENKIQTFYKSFKPDINVTPAGWESIISFNTKKEREIIIYSSTFGCLSDFYIGLQESATLSEPDGYTYKTPVVFYGSSITHGASADRAALAYPSIISRNYDTDFINLGFSGSAKGETEFANYISTLDMSAFVYDYDHNAPNPEHLLSTHEPMYKIVRKAHPDLPIIMVTRPQTFAIPEAEAEERKKIIYTTYKNALDRGENVYFIDGGHFYDDFGLLDCAMDDSHPNTIGLFAMAKSIGKTVAETLNLKHV